MGAEGDTIKEVQHAGVFRVFRAGVFRESSLRTPIRIDKRRVFNERSAPEWQPGTGFEEVGRIGTGKSACGK